MAKEIKENLAWAKIDLEEGLWEYMDDENDGETYQSGGLWIEDNVLEDYDGCFELPALVVFLLKEDEIDCSILND